MSRKMTAPALLILCAVVIATGLTQPTSAMMPDSGPAASGHGNLTAGGELRTFSFTAVTHKDGTVTGQAQLINRAQDVRVHLDIDCLRVVGNRAVVSGIVKNSSDPTLDGFRGVFSVQDNGEGANDPPDTISLVFFFPPNVPIDCNSGVVFPMLPIEAGNIQVRP